MDLAIVYMVAGVSSRFGGRIKQFAKVGPEGESLIEYSLKQALKAGFNKIIFVVGEKTESVFKEKFKDSFLDVPVYYAYQDYDENKRDKPWGTVDALCSIKEIINCPFVVCNGDDIYGDESFKILSEHLSGKNEEATVGYKLGEVIPDKGAVHRAIFEIDEEGYVKDLDEIFNIDKSDLDATNTKHDDLCSMNIFALFPETVMKLNERLEFFKFMNRGSRTAECLLPNEVNELIKTNKIKLKIYPSSGKWFGITNPEDEEVVREALKE
ncbi:MAG: sugar phosphate nucleotidyltransferase [archaeon]